MAAVTVRGLSKSFDGVRVFSGVGFDLEGGRITAILGPSGRGKTTLLRIICGLERQDSGDVRIEAGVSCSMAFQEPRLLPWLTVLENMSFSLGEKGIVPAKRWLDELGLCGFEGRYPGEMSGGERQRANLARALAAGSGLLLLDEPFSSIGLGLKARLLPRLRGALAKEGRTAVMVTHSPVDVALMADAFYLMDAEGSGALGPYGLELDGEARDLEDASMGREVHRLMLMMASLSPGMGDSDGR